MLIYKVVVNYQTVTCSETVSETFANKTSGITMAGLDELGLECRVWDNRLNGYVVRKRTDAFE